ncbi:MAG: hypothetical protein LC808_08720 [Actinobacteria bacterium]|nr:hypothetical protein [Actinomycetota bacterium]
MSADPVSEPVRRADDDGLGRLVAIDQRLHQISTHLANIDKLLCQLDEARANLETLLGSARPIVAGVACQPPDCGERIMSSGRRLSLPQRPPVEHSSLTEAPSETSPRSGPVRHTRYPVGSDG